MPDISVVTTAAPIFCGAVFPQGSKLEQSGDRAGGAVRQSQEARAFVSRESYGRMLLSLVRVRFAKRFA